MKKYLNSVEDVVKALKEGGKVWDEECNSYCQIVNGFITEFSKGDNTIITVNSSIYFMEGKDRFYTEEPEQLKFEVNRAYKTRSGHKAFLDFKTINSLSFLCSESSSIVFVTTLGGKIRNNDDCLLDIIAYWEEEK